MNYSDLAPDFLVRISMLSEFSVLLSKVTLLFIVSWLLHFSLARVNPRWRVFLWRGVALGAVVSLLWNVGLPRFDIRVPAPSHTALANMSAPYPSPISNENPSISGPQITVIPHETISAIEMPTTHFEDLAGTARERFQGSAMSGFSYSWQTITVVVWGLGFVLLLIRLIIGQSRIRQLSKASRSTPEHVVAEARRVSVELGCRSTVTVRCSHECAVPFLTGVLRPIIILPERMCEPHFQRDLPAVLAHELAHVRSSDVAWNVVIHATSIFLWFHPLVWRIGAAHRAACDAVCDAVSATLLGDVQAYCRILAKVALDACSLRSPSALAMAQACDVRRRVEILQRNVSSFPLRRRAVMAMCLFGFLSLSFLAGVRLTMAQPVPKDISDSPVALPAETSATSEQNDQRERSATSKESHRTGFRPMRIRVLQRDGNPVVNAGITVRATTDVLYGPVRYRTDAEGIAVVEVPDREKLDLQLLVWAEHCVTVGAFWHSTAVQEAIPSEFTVEMEAGTSFGGTVQDEQGQPIPGAKVTVEGRKQSGNEVLWFSIHDTSTTDEGGRWECHRIPAELAGFDVDIEVRHPDFASTPAVDYKTFALDELRHHSAALVMHTGLAIEGTITDPEGRPVAGAMVGQYIKRYTNTARATTDENGHYRLPPCDPGEYVLAVVADGFAPNSRGVTLTDDQRSFDLQLQRGESIRLRIVDQDGKPVAGAFIGTGLDREILFLDNTRRALPGNDRNLTTNAEGRWSRLWIPEDYLEFHIRKSGYGTIRKSFKPDKQEQIVILEAGNWSVSGRVVDRETKAPVTKFNVVVGDTYGGAEDIRSWHESLFVEHDDGRYRASWDTSGDSRRVIRIEAEGYLPSQARSLKTDEMQVVYNVELEKGYTVAGVVRTPDGKPLADVDVALCTTSRGLYLRNGKPALDQNPLIVRTGADGQFSFAPPGEGFALIAMHEQGFARVEGDMDAKEIILQPWARVEGTLRIRDAAAPNEMLTLTHDESHQGDNTPRAYYEYRTTTDEDGHFAFERVIPGNGRVMRNVIVDMGRGMSKWIPTHATKASFVTGETIKVQLIRSGRPVVGKFEMPDGRSQYDWRHAMVSLQAVVKAPELPLPKDIDPQKDQEAAIKWWEEWKETEEGKQFEKEMQHYQAALRAALSVSYSTNIESTGDFTFDDIPDGDYQLTVHAQAEPKAGHIDPGRAAASLSHTFTIPKMPGGRSEESLDLGTLTLKEIQIPKVNQ